MKILSIFFVLPTRKFAQIILRTLWNFWCKINHWGGNIGEKIKIPKPLSDLVRISHRYFLGPCETFNAKGRDIKYYGYLKNWKISNRDPKWGEESIEHQKIKISKTKNRKKTNLNLLRKWSLKLKDLTCIDQGPIFF